jgi:trafficking protein particle complex subunit 2
MSFILNSSLDIFDIRSRAKTLDQDLGLLHPIDERLAAYGWLTNTGIKFIIVVDMAGREDEDISPGSGSSMRPGAKPVYGLRDAELKPAFRAVHTAYIQLLQNPFYTPEDRTPLQLANQEGRSAEIKSGKFASEVQRIGRMWYPGIGSI